MIEMLAAAAVALVRLAYGVEWCWVRRAPAVRALKVIGALAVLPLLVGLWLVHAAGIARPVTGPLLDQSSAELARAMAT